MSCPDVYLTSIEIYDTIKVRMDSHLMTMVHLVAVTSYINVKKSRHWGNMITKTNVSVK
jgi:hypothetical protein